MGKRKGRKKGHTLWSSSRSLLSVPHQFGDDEDDGRQTRKSKPKGGKPMYTGTYSNCGHEGNVRVFNIQGRHVYGAGTAIRFSQNTALVIDLAHSYNNGAKKPKSARSFIGSMTDDDLKALFPEPPDPPKPKRLSLDWPDMQAPDIDVINVAFWQKVWEIMPVAPDDLPASQAPHTIICCMGGHGRTGTCMAALLIANAGFSMANAVNFVRYNHCIKAVESQVQFTYLRALAKLAGTNTQPLNEALVEKLELLGKKAAEPEPSKQPGFVAPSMGPTVWVPDGKGGFIHKDAKSATPATAPELADDEPGVINQPMSPEEIAKGKAAFTNGNGSGVMPLDDLALSRARFFCVQGPDGLTWVSRKTYDAGAYGVKPEILGVRFV